MLTHIKTIFFDFDGTLHDSIHVYAPAFIKGYDYLVANNYAPARTWSHHEISYWLGYNSVDMWNSFMPKLDEDIRKIASKIVGDEISLQIRSGNGALYPKTIETLKYLTSKDYTLVFLSNCGTYYKDLVRAQFHLDLYFDEMICSEDFNQIPKHEILKQIIPNYMNDMVIVGDRFQDIESGLRNDIFTIGCEYGYGTETELNQSNYKIKELSQLMTLL